MAHEMSCASNPERVKHKHSPKAGAQKGCVPWNAGKSFHSVSLQKTIDIIENNLHFDMHEQTARKHAKRYLIHKNGNVCSICGISTWQNQPAPLVCDHISGDSTDNRIENFRLVCCNCDAQLPTYKSKNKGKGRKYDREYYNLRKANPTVGDGTRLENERA